MKCCNVCNVRLKKEDDDTEDRAAAEGIEAAGEVNASGYGAAAWDLGQLSESD